MSVLIIVTILAVSVSVIQGAPTINTYKSTSTKPEMKNTDLKRDIQLASSIATFTLTAIDNNFNKYCTRVPLIFSCDCNQFLAMLQTKIDWPLPKMVIENALNFENHTSVKEAISNMTRTVIEYLNLIKQHLDMEYKIVCEPAIKIQVECHFPKMCSSLSDTNDAILYCSLHAAYTYLDNLRVLLQLLISDSTLKNVDVDSQLAVPKNLPILCGRWLTMLTVRTSLKQVQFIQQTLTAISQGL